MNSYENIPLWENTRRIKVLRKFHHDVVSYFKNSSYMEMAGTRTENAEAVQARRKINLTVDQAHRIIIEAGIAPTVTWTPPPMFGGYVQQIYLILNLFELDNYQISAKHAVALIERALGVYQSDRTAALRRTLNPFWWLWRGLLWFVRIPFVLLGALGVNTARAEVSVFGKIFKLMVATSALLTILKYMGWLSAAMVLLGIE